MENENQLELSLAFDYGSKQCLLCFLSISEFINGRYYKLSIGCKGYFHDYCAKKLENHGFIGLLNPHQLTPHMDHSFFRPRWRDPPF